MYHILPCDCYIEIYGIFAATTATTLIVRNWTIDTRAAGETLDARIISSPTAPTLYLISLPLRYLSPTTRRPCHCCDRGAK